MLPDTASRAPCPASALAIALPSPPDAPVTSAVIPVRSNIYAISFASASMSSIVTTLVTFASGAMRLTIGAKHLAADLDEFLDARIDHVGDALAPADHAGDLLDQLIADRVGIGRPAAR